MKKYMTRREAIKTGLLAGAYAGGGYVVGGIYNTLKNSYNSLKEKVPNLKKELGKIDKNVDNKKYALPTKELKDLEDKRINFWEKVFKIEEKGKKNSENKIENYSNKNQPSFKNKKVSRRGFFKYLLNSFYEHPKSFGTAVGAGYGLAKGTLNSKGDPYKIYEEQAKKERGEMKKIIEEQNEKIGGLEKKLNSEEKERFNKILLGFGFFAIMISLFFSISSLTGFTFIENIPTLNKNHLLFGIFAFFGALILFYISKRFK